MRYLCLSWDRAWKFRGTPAHVWVGLGLLLGGCPIPEGDIDTDVTSDPPDITGTYTVLPLTEVSGCEGEPAADTSWMEGELLIAGTPDGLTFTFPGGEVLDGEVDPAFTWSMAGTVSRNPVQLDVFGEGLVFIGDVTWILDGDVSLSVLDSTASPPACTLTGRLEAEQDPP